MRRAELDESVSSAAEDYDAGRVAAFEEEVDRGLSAAQQLLAGEGFLPLMAAGEQPDLAAPAPSSLAALVAGLRRELRELRREAPAAGSPAETLNRLYRLLILFALHAHGSAPESLADHPALGCIARCQALREGLDSAPAPALPPAPAPVLAAQANPISREMLRNRGIPKLRSLRRQTPRVRQKERFRKAGLRARSRGAKARRVAPRVYAGEAGGIRAGVNRAIDI